LGGNQREEGLDRATVGPQGLESLKTKLEASKPREEERPKKVLQRFVWLSPRSFAKVCELADQLKTSTSQVISLIIDDYFERGLSLFERPKVEVRNVFVCPECGREEEGGVYVHFSKYPDCGNKVLYKILELRRGK